MAIKKYKYLLDLSYLVLASQQKGHIEPTKEAE